MRAHWFGDRAVRIDDADYRTVSAVRAALPNLSVRVGIDCLLVVSPVPSEALLTQVTDALQAIPAGSFVPNAEVVVIEVEYRGEDLDHAAGVLGCSSPDLIRAHQLQQWRVAMVGFAPGFGYLVPEGPRLLEWARIPRLDRPRSRVPAGSVAIAAGMSAVYPSAMPGGWHLIGRSNAVLFDVGRVGRESLLDAGVAVRFEERR